MRTVSLLLAILLIAAPAFGRGKNKFSYERGSWQIYESEHFKFFYYEKEAHRLQQVVDMAETAYVEVSEKLQHQTNFKIPLVFYKTQEEFERTNIFPGFVPSGVQAFADPFQSRMVLPIDLAPEDLYGLIAHELTHIFQYSMLYNNKISTILRAQAPTWFTEGMASYIAKDEDNFGRMVLRDSAINSNFGSLGNLVSSFYAAYRVGHAVFDFIEDEWGIEGVRNLLFQYRKNVRGNVGSAIERAFEIEISEFDRKFKKYLRKRYVNLLPVKEEPDDHAREILTEKVFSTLSAELSPSGDLFAALVNIKNELDVVLVSTKDGRLFKNLTKGYTNRYETINIGSFSGKNDLAWSKDGTELAFGVKTKGRTAIMIVNVLTGDIVEELIFNDLRNLSSPAFSNDGNQVFFSATQSGIFDIFSYNRNNKKVLNHTNDDALDNNPRIAPNDKELLYSSIRNGFYKIIALDLESGKKTQLTSGLGNDIQAGYTQDMKQVYFSSDRFDDIYNIYRLDLANGEMERFTNLLTGAFSPQERVAFDHREGKETKQLVFTAYYQGRFRLYRMEKPEVRAEKYEASMDNYSYGSDRKISSGLELDKERYSEYKAMKNFTISGVGLNVGVTDDGTFLTNSGISFGDVLGNHELTINTYSISSYESYDVLYVDRSRRWHWGSSVTWDEQYFVFFVPGFGYDRIRQTRYITANGFLRYPFSLFTRVDVGAGFEDWDSIIPGFNAQGQPEFTSFDFSGPSAFVRFSRDTIRYSYFGPINGMGLDLTYRNNFGNYDSWGLNFSAYKELSRRTLLAFRTIADRSEGDFPIFYYLGGNDYLRGDYRYREFFGTRRFLTQLEFRFPFIDRLQFPGFEFTNIRGAFFVEAGGAWSDDDLFNFEFQPSDGTETDPPFNPDNPNRNYLIGAYGTEISMALLGLEVHWTWSYRTNYEDFPSKSLFSFWIGRKF